jgi:signal transduction histidine kinase
MRRDWQDAALPASFLGCRTRRSGVASQWRIRHKLLLGLAIVVGVLIVLLLESLNGLASYRTTMNSMDSKLVELGSAQRLQTAMTKLASPDDPRSEQDQVEPLRGKIREARGAFQAYQRALDDTLSRGRDPDGGYKEKEYIDALEQCFHDLDLAMQPFNEATIAHEQSSPRSDKAVNAAIFNLVRSTEDLHDTINKDLFDRISEAKHQFRMSMWIVLTTSVVGVLLMVSLSRFFYTWIFYPIRDLEQGVARVAKGDFEYRIDLHSGDEMQDLAAAFDDMTARLRDMYRDLERQVNERSRQLVRSERLASVGFLAAGVAHEINNPLHAIALCSEALEGRLKGIANYRMQFTDLKNGALQSAIGTLQSEWEVIRKHLKTIQDEAFRCKAITERLLEFSRGGERKREPIGLDELVQSVLDVAQHLQNCKGKRIVFEPVGRVVVWVNALEMKSVVLNLVVNALDSMEEGGTMTISLRQRNGRAELVFADTGCGMGPEVLENIFEPFYTRSRTGKGTGLGLTISHRIITQHGGEIEAASAGLNRGSTFTVRLPLQPAEPIKEELLGHAAA